ncbi:MAG: aldehyde ferredoxin oxidoreductase family protein [Chloroflexi bacterium]|nr:aldehyde ferredoxin oxidoreductase family protein [Chloroflexota bacterium]
MYGYGGTILRINLTTGTIVKEPLSEDMIRQNIGGRGFNAALLFSETKEGCDPLGADNKLIIATGPLTGTSIPSSGNAVFSSISPLTGGYGEAVLSGHFGPEVKYAGYDVVLIEGKADVPSYIFIDDEKVEIRDASAYWGKGCIQAETFLKISLGEKFQMVCIGPAGENKVSFATISHNYGVLAGRCGLGAVMGSKNLKAVAVRGNGGVKHANPDSFIKISREMHHDMVKHPELKEWQDFGTARWLAWANEHGALPTNNFYTGSFEGVEGITPEIMRKHIVLNDRAAFASVMALGKYSHVKTRDTEFWVEGPNYDCLVSLGSNLGLGKIHQVANLTYLCEELGMDPVSAGGVLAFAAEASEKKILSAKKADGLNPGFGKVDVFVTLLIKISRREGIGNLMADGVKKFAASLGKGAAEFAMEMKGLEVGGFEARCYPVALLAYRTGDIGGLYQRSHSVEYDIEKHKGVSEEKKAEMVIEQQHLRTIFDMLGVSELAWSELGLEIERYVDAFNEVTGLNLKLDDFIRASERVWNMTRILWERCGAKKLGKLDYIPPRWENEPIPDGPNKGCKYNAAEGEKLLAAYYRIRGWDESGKPKDDMLKELQLV